MCHVGHCQRAVIDIDCSNLSDSWKSSKVNSVIVMGKLQYIFSHDLEIAHLFGDNMRCDTPPQSKPPRQMYSETIDVIDRDNTENA